MSTFCSPATYTPTNVRYKKRRCLNICFIPTFNLFIFWGPGNPGISTILWATALDTFGALSNDVSKGTPTRPGPNFCYYWVSRLFKARWHAYPSNYNQNCSISDYYVVDGFCLQNVHIFVRPVPPKRGRQSHKSGQWGMWTTCGETSMPSYLIMLNF
jgi:hypothetical protein